MVDHPAARALTGYLLVRGGVHQVAYARAVENLTGADLSKLFPAPRIPTEKIPECKPHIKRGEHTKLYRFSHERLPRARRGLERHRTRRPATTSSSSRTRPRASRRSTCRSQEGVFAPDYAPEEIAEIAVKLRKAAGLSDEPTGVVANDTNGVMGRIKEAVS